MGSEVVVSLVIGNALAREGLKRILSDSGFHVIQSVGHLGELVTDDTEGPHIVICDGPLLPLENAEDLHIARSHLANVRLVLLEDVFDFDLMSRAFSIGAHAYIRQDVPFQTLLTMITLVALGEKVVPSELIEVLQDLPLKQNRETRGNIAQIYNLTDREKQILDCLVMGLPNKVISRELGISEATVKVTVKGIFRKMSVSNRTQAAMLAREGRIGPVEFLPSSDQDERDGDEG